MINNIKKIISRVQSIFREKTKYEFSKTTHPLSEHGIVKNYKCKRRYFYIWNKMWLSTVFCGTPQSFIIVCDIFFTFWTKWDPVKTLVEPLSHFIMFPDVYLRFWTKWDRVLSLLEFQNAYLTLCCVINSNNNAFMKPQNTEHY